MNKDIILPENTAQMADFLKDSGVDFSRDNSFTASCKMAKKVNSYKSSFKNLGSFVNQVFPDDNQYLAEHYQEHYKENDYQWKVAKFVAGINIASIFPAIYAAGRTEKLSLILYIPIIASFLACYYKKFSLKNNWMKTEGKTWLQIKKNDMSAVPRCKKELEELGKRLPAATAYLTDFVRLNYDAVPEKYWGEAKALLDIYTSRRASDISQAINVLEQDKAMKRIREAAEANAASAEEAAHYAHISADAARGLIRPFDD